jgi:hypothetical protein
VRRSIERPAAEINHYIIRWQRSFPRSQAPLGNARIEAPASLIAFRLSSAIPLGLLGRLRIDEVNRANDELFQSFDPVSNR